MLPIDIQSQSSTRGGRPGPSHDAEIVSAIEAACSLDREYAERHPAADSYVRPGLLHELDLPGDQCRGWVDFVRVVFLAPGCRLRGAA